MGRVSTLSGIWLIEKKLPLDSILFDIASYLHWTRESLHQALIPFGIKYVDVIIYNGGNILQLQAFVVGHSIIDTDQI